MLPKLFLSFLLVTTCVSEEAKEPTSIPAPSFLIDSLEARGDAKIGGLPLALIVSIELTNTGSVPSEFVVPLYCPLIVQLFYDSSGELVYESRGRPCPRAARIVRIDAGASEQLTMSLPLSELTLEEGVTPGKYSVVAVIIVGSESLRVEAGEVLIPEGGIR
jgi:hypothetical protein